MVGEDCDLYDDIFIQDKDEEEDNLEDLYGNIHNPEVAESALEKVKSLTSKCDKLENQNTELKRQVSILTNLNQELTNKNQNLERNFKELIETCRTEINRKNDQYKTLRAEFDNVLFKRAARNCSARELETIMMRVKLPDDAFPRLPTQADKKAAKMKVAVAQSPDVNVVSTRQFIKKRKLSGESKKDAGGDDDVKRPKSDTTTDTSNSQSSSSKLKMDISNISKYVKERKKKPKPDVSNDIMESSDTSKQKDDNKDSKESSKSSKQKAENKIEKLEHVKKKQVIESKGPKSETDEKKETTKAKDSKAENDKKPLQSKDKISKNESESRSRNTSNTADESAKKEDSASSSRW